MAERGLVSTVDEAIAYVRDSEALDPAEMSRRLEDVRALASKTQDALADAEREVRNLSNLYVMHVRLFAELTSRSVADAVQEIIINFLGSEDFAFYVLGDQGFAPRAGMGPALEKAAAFTREDDGPLADVLRAGEPSYTTPGAVALAAFPDSAGAAVGLLEVRTLMRHKRWLNNRDKELLSILRTQAGMALGIALEREARAAPASRSRPSPEANAR